MTPEAPYRLAVLGPPALTRADGTSVRSVLAQPKRVALLTFLRTEGTGSAVVRDAVLGTFWPDVPEERALAALRQGIHFLRRSIEGEIVERDADHLLRVPPGRLSCDVEDFERALAEDRLEAALDLYRGPFLAGLPVDESRALDDWIESRRRRLHMEAVDAAVRLAERAFEAGRPVAAAAWGARVVDLDPLEERGTALLVEAHARAGDAVAAVRAYEHYAAHLAREMDLAPTAELAERVRRLQESPEPSAPGSASEPADVPDGPAATIDSPPAPAPPADGPAPRRRVPAVLLAGAVAFALLWKVVPHERPPAAVTSSDLDGERPSVAVLPFTNLSGDTANAFFAAGIHESVLVNLSRIGSIDVTALRAVRAYADSELPPAEIARRLDVTTLMSGSVQRDGNRIRIIVELADARAGTQLWSESFDRRLDDVFAVQSEIARSVANSLRAALTPSELDRIGRRPTESLDALEHYMRARAAYADLSPEGMDRAQEAYGLAIAADPSFAAAWAGRADAVLQRVQFFGYPLTWADTARALVERAIALDPDLPEAYKTLGFLHSVHGRERAALEAVERALELRPAYADALNNAGWSRYLLGDVAGAERLIRRSFRLQPTVPQLRSNVGAILAALGRHDEAATWLDGVLETDPEITAARSWRTFVDLDRGDARGALRRAEQYLVDEPAELAATARAAFAALLAREPERAARYAERVVAAGTGSDPFDMRRIETVLAAAHRALGRDADAERWARRALDAERARQADGADGWDPPWERAAALAVLGESEDALTHLALAVEEGLPHPSLLRMDPAFDGVRDDPRFEELVAEVERRADAQRALSLGSG